MIPTVQDRARAIATFRFLNVWAMETLARWTPTTPEMEAKVMFGRHIWDFAQMADALGKRTFELRKPMHYTVPPSRDYEALLKDIAGKTGTAGRVAAFYDGLLPGLIARYRAYIGKADPILDEPSIVILERIVRDLERQRADADALVKELGLSRATDVAAREAAIRDVVGVEVAA